MKPVLMGFDGVEIDSRELRVGTTFHWVITNLMASKDTIKILADLNSAFPFAKNDLERDVQQALGPDNRDIIDRAVQLLESGDVPGLGCLMTEAQALFDRKVMPACTELLAPVLHDVLHDPTVLPLVYGGKGVGSQGDGSVQFLAKGEDEAKALQDYLFRQRGMPSFTLTLKPGQTVKKAIIPRSDKRFFHCAVGGFSWILHHTLHQGKKREEQGNHRRYDNNSNQYLCYSRNTDYVEIWK